MIGVNSQIASDAARSEGSQPGSTGVGFAISSDTVSEVVKTIESGGGESPQQTEGPSATRGQEGEERREVRPYGPEASGGGRSEGYGEARPPAAGPAEVEAGGAGREGQVVIVP